MRGKRKKNDTAQILNRSLVTLSTKKSTIFITKSQTFLVDPFNMHICKTLAYVPMV